MNQTTLIYVAKHWLLRRITLSIAFVGLALVTSANAQIVPTNQLVAGRSCGEWSAYFWKHGLEFPPLTFSSYLKVQSAPVLHLYGSSLPTVRTIEIPDDRFLFVEILGLACTTLDVPPLDAGSTNESDMRMLAESFIATDLFLEIDGVA